MKLSDRGLPSGLMTVGLMAAGLTLGACSTSGFKSRDQLVAPVNCAPQTFEIYFVEGGASLSPVAYRAIEMTAERLRGCRIRSVAVTGLADATGSDAVNLALSERRAAAVSEVILAAGWPVPAIDVEAVGSQGARSGAVNAPLRRRTEVVVDAVPAH